MPLGDHRVYPTIPADYIYVQEFGTVEDGSLNIYVVPAGYTLNLCNISVSSYGSGASYGSINVLDSGSVFKWRLYRKSYLAGVSSTFFISPNIPFEILTSEIITLNSGAANRFLQVILNGYLIKV